MPLPENSLRTFGTRCVVALSTVFSVGCASISPADAKQDTPVAAPTTATATVACQEPSTESALKGMVAAGIGSALDKKTGGGKGFEKMLGKGTDYAARGCLQEKTATFPEPK